MPEFNLSRRGLMGAGMLAVAAAGQRLNAAPGPSETVFDEPALQDYAQYAQSFDNALNGAYYFLDTMMDAYVSGQTIRLIQSYSDQGGLLSTGFTYDNALAIHAYLARNGSNDLWRAEVLGKGLLHAQANNFPTADGRFGQAYFVNAPDGTGAYITPAANPFYFYTSSVGDQCWAGMALLQLYKRTGDTAYLNGALWVANWVVSKHFDTQGPGGFSWGTVINPDNSSSPSTNGKSTEHNIDAYAFFTMLASLSHGKAQNGMTWSSLATHAWNFVYAMFNPKGGFFYVGTNGDQITTSTSIIAEDCQTWSYLASLCKDFGVSIDWVLTHLITIDTPSSPNTAMSALGNVAIQGEVYTSASLWGNPTSFNPHAVWLEGTGHTACALLIRKNPASTTNPLEPGDIATAFILLENIKTAQYALGKGQTVNGAALNPGQGIVAVTGNMDTGFGFGYYPNQHIGATAWYLLALRAANPFQLGY